MDTLWEARYDTGIDLIDTQHRDLVAAVNRLRRSVLERCGRVDIERQVHQVVALAEEHIASEESLMAEEGYPDLGPHTVEHASMMDRLYELETRLREGNDAVAMMVTTFVDGWLKHHVSEGDLGFVAFLEEKRRKQAGRQS